MRWQDAVIAVVSILFAVALIPTVRGQTKPALSTSLLTTAGLSTFVAVYISLGLWFAAATSVVSALMWATIAFQTVGQT